MPSTINLIYKATLGQVTGLERDALIIQEILKPYRFKFNHYRITERRLFKKYNIPQSLASKINAYCKTRLKKFDINIFLEKIYPELCDLADVNILIPNQERFGKVWLPLLDNIDVILCKTKYAEDIFKKCFTRVEYIGFSSLDRLSRTNKLDYTHFIHVGGKSSYRRGTHQILDLWKKYPHLPQLSVIARNISSQEYVNYPNIKILDNYVPDGFLRKLQNQAGIHLCLSEAEGFGHFIMEGLSCGACIITTNGQPMNELVQPDRGYLVNCASIEMDENDFERKFHFDPVNLEETILRIIEEPEAEKIEKSLKARQYFEESNLSFRESLPKAIKNLL